MIRGAVRTKRPYTAASVKLCSRPFVARAAFKLSAIALQESSFFVRRRRISWFSGSCSAETLREGLCRAPVAVEVVVVLAVLGFLVTLTLLDGVGGVGICVDVVVGGLGSKFGSKRFDAGAGLASEIQGV